MPLFTILVDHENGASYFSQLEADTVRGALVRWAEKLEAPPWEGFSEDQRDEILDQIQQDTDEEKLSTGIDGCRFLWREDYALRPGDRCIRVLIVKTSDV